MAYKALVARIHTRPLPGSDNIVLGVVGGYQVIVNKDIEEGSLGVFFEAGGQLSEAFAAQNDLVARKNPDGSRAGGFFEENRRVKALKLRGARSEGFFCPLEHFAYTGYALSQLREGDEFNELNGQPICQKYITRATRSARGRWSNGGARNTNRGETPMFPKHVETEQLKRTIKMIPAGAVLYLTEKVHGTSFRYGRVLEAREPQTRWERLHRWVDRRFSRITQRTTGWNEWRALNGSRNVIIERRQGQGFYGNEDFRLTATQGIALRKGEVLFGELAGYTETGAPIMSTHKLAGLKDKKLQQYYGDEVTYSYGAVPGQCQLYVYRITLANEDGDAVELSWPQVMARCQELGLKAVPLCCAPFVYDGDAEKLLSLVSTLVDGSADCPEGTPPSSIDPRHPQEGVVVRYESAFGTGFLKQKAFTFGVAEGYLKERDDYVDEEESA